MSLLIQIVEDDISQSEPLRKLLVENEYDVVVHPSAQEAILWLNAHTPHLMLLDINLEEDNMGYRIMPLCVKKNILTIIMSSRKNIPFEVSSALRAGAVQFLPKPFNPYQLLMTIENLLASILPLCRQNRKTDQLLPIYDKVYIDSARQELVDETVEPPISVVLRPNQSKILSLFSIFGATILTRSDLVNNVWDGQVSDSSFYSEISRLNNTLAQAGTAYRLINTRRSTNPGISTYEFKKE
jgi:DNA-binding response OmpR family regulator